VAGARDHPPPLPLPSTNERGGGSRTKIVNNNGRIMATSEDTFIFFLQKNIKYKKNILINY
jgi:hypothetical protein